ncbi:uncharacterized protein LOC125681507 [Ostrea edulis]|uniref:uncharacterized protein LOC125681507 n=1 Tax=Ostrea edulis TaxID=37623 RepID=UPI0024AF83D2|nr:uncharacterized protein LOC125681507 [Ostrea edulis]XP_048777612.2 uncharacterized protein LOC125681507 [Ostrea edulis]XP_048777613.2 uncharacterized protein LOC125681507 [Ostrea edulis]
MLSMKTNREMDIYKRQYKSQEFARELNKREQRRLDQEVGGRGGIEAEYRFNLDKVNQERKEIEKELNKIRGGVHKQLGHHATLSSDKKFYHPKFKDFGMKDTSGRSPRLQRKALTDSNSRERESSPMDAEMLIEYLQNFNKEHAQEHNAILDGIKGSGRFNQNKYNDLPHVQINPLIISDQSEVSEAENANDSEEQKQYIQTLSDSQPQGTLSNGQAGTKEIFLQIENRSESGETTNMSSPRHNAARRLSADKGNHVTPGASSPRHSPTRRLSSDQGKHVNSVANDTVYGHPRHSPTRRLSSDQGKHVISVANDAVHGHPRHSPTRRLSSDQGKHVNSVANDAVHGHPRHSPTRRLSSDQGKHVNSVANEAVHGHPRHSPTRRLSMDKGVHASPIHIDDEPTEQWKEVTEIENENVLKEVETEDVKIRPIVPLEYVEVEQKPSKLAIGPESFNPDGSLKTMYTAPSFESSWEEAKKARYIRTREPLDRDRQLSANEIFDKTS